MSDYIDKYLGRPNRGYIGCGGCCELTEEVIQYEKAIQAIKDLPPWGGRVGDLAAVGANSMRQDVLNLIAYHMGEL